ncbi:MAG TPA: hypothetical protein PK950_01195 [Candidatus Paceibacterota bacterium]|nr:hypothetical protein [Candidatus Paceibacterota bacterium]
MTPMLILLGIALLVWTIYLVSESSSLIRTSSKSGKGKKPKDDKKSSGIKIGIGHVVVAAVSIIVLFFLWKWYTGYQERSDISFEQQRDDMTEQKCIRPKQLVFTLKNELRFADLEDHQRPKLRNFHAQIAGGTLTGTDMFGKFVRLYPGMDLWGDQYRQMNLKVESGDTVYINICYYEKPF